MTDALRAAEGGSVPATVEKLVVPEIRSLWSSVPEGADLVASLLAAHAQKGSGFVFIIDEWDAPIREAKDPSSKREYVEFLRGLFKNGVFTPKCVEAAYLTGILPIVKYGTQSAMSDFDEYTIVNPQGFAPYVGFVEEEVKELCEEHELDFQEMRRWYDGYELPRAGHVYSPYSVIKAVQNQEFGSYWTSTSSFDSLLTYIQGDFDGLQDTIAALVAGEYVPVNVRSFRNDMDDVRSADDVLTVLIHLGYLAYDKAAAMARVPNEEVRLEFVDALKETTHPTLAGMVASADKLLKDTLAGNEEAVAQGVARAHDSRLGPDWYNDEQALRFAVKLAYLTSVDRFAEIEELPSGHGRADIVYLPRRYDRIPAMIVELKWDKEPSSALDQVRQRDYPKVLRNYGGPVLLVGITYSSKTKEHVCRIERLAAR